MLEPKTPKAGEITYEDEDLPKIPEIPSDEDPTLKVTPLQRAHLGISNAWKFLDKKKTVIGGVAYIAGDLLVGSKVGGVLKIIGMIFSGVGLTHKAEKKLNEKTSGETIQWREILNLIINFLKAIFKKKEK